MTGVNLPVLCVPGTHHPFQHRVGRHGPLALVVGDVGQLDEVEDLGSLPSLTESPPAQHRHVRLTQPAAGVEFLELLRLLHSPDDLTAVVQEEGMLQFDDG